MKMKNINLIKKFYYFYIKLTLVLKTHFNKNNLLSIKSDIIFKFKFF